jgi:hypothetical protein
VNIRPNRLGLTLAPGATVSVSWPHDRSADRFRSGQGGQRVHSHDATVGVKRPGADNRIRTWPTRRGRVDLGVAGHKWSEWPRETSSDATVSAITDTETDESANAVKSDTEAGQLADLVRELTGRLTEQTALTAIWQERARVLGEQLALAAPLQPVDASGSMQGPGPSTEPDYRRWRAEREQPDMANAVRPWWRSWAVYGGAGIIVLVLAIGLVALLR